MYEKRLEEQKQERENRKKELRDALYSELGYTYCTFREKVIPFIGKWDDIFLYLKTHNSFATVIDTLDLIMTNGFDVYKSMREDPVLFYQLQDAFALADVYRTLNLSINELLRKFRDLQETEFSEEKKIKRAQALHQTVSRQYQWVTGVLRLKLQAKKIDSDLLTQFISDEEDKDFLRELAKVQKTTSQN